MLGENIRKYRKRKKLSLRDLGEILELSHTAIDKYEKNQVIPNSTVLIKLANVFDIKVADLFKNSQEEVVIKDIHYRKRSSFSKRNQEIVEEITKEELEKYLEVSGFFPKERIAKVELDLLSFKINKYEEIEDKVIELREKLNLGVDPISNLLKLLEELGFIIIFVEPLKGFDGKSGLVEDKPFIVLSDNMPGDRQRNSLAHELGHILVKHNELDDEKIANHFAGAFLIPKISLIKDLGNRRSTLTMFELRSLKEKYKVSMQSIIYRAEQLDIISENEKIRLFKLFSLYGYRTKEPIEIEREKSYKFEQMLCEAVAEGYISESKAAEYLNVKTIQFIENYMGSKVYADNQ